MSGVYKNLYKHGQEHGKRQAEDLIHNELTVVAKKVQRSESHLSQLTPINICTV